MAQPINMNKTFNESSEDDSTQGIAELQKFGKKREAKISMTQAAVAIGENANGMHIRAKTRQLQLPAERNDGGEILSGFDLNHSSD